MSEDETSKTKSVPAQRIFLVSLMGALTFAFLIAVFFGYWLFLLLVVAAAAIAVLVHAVLKWELIRRDGA